MNFETLEKTKLGGVTLTRFVSNKTAVSTVALMTAFAAITPAYATIDNTVTVTAQDPNGDPILVDDDGDPLTPPVPPSADETVDVADADPQVVVTKTATLLNGAAFDPDVDNAGVGDVITYEYTFLNNGNVTITDISLTDVHAGNGTLTQNDDETLTDNAPLNGASAPDTSGDSTDAVAADGTFSSLAPGDLVTYTSTYTIVQADLDDNGGGDGDIDNTVTFAASPAAGAIDPTQLTVDESVLLEAPAPSLAVTKVADDDTDVIVGQTITYTYTVTNNGNVPVSSISLGDVVTAGSGGNPSPEVLGGSLIDVAPTGDSTPAPVAGDTSVTTLGVGDSIQFTGTYVVTQDDVDNLQ